MSVDYFPIKRIGVFTSGGDAPGMNACVRAGIYNGCEVVGIQDGYEGMIDGKFVDRGARSERFRTPEGRAVAADELRKAGVEGLIAIGGDGTFQRAAKLQEEHAVPVTGVPGTIDNDLFGKDYTIGFDTAVNTAMEALLEGKSGVMAGEIRGKIAFTDLQDSWTERKTIDKDLWCLAPLLAT